MGISLIVSLTAPPELELPVLHIYNYATGAPLFSFLTIDKY